MPSEPSSKECLIQRGRLAQQMLAYREQAAQFKAAAACLAEAIFLAESGDDTKLRSVLDSIHEETWMPSDPSQIAQSKRQSPESVPKQEPVNRLAPIQSPASSPVSALKESAPKESASIALDSKALDSKAKAPKEDKPKANEPKTGESNDWSEMLQGASKRAEPRVPAAKAPSHELKPKTKANPKPILTPSIVKKTRPIQPKSAKYGLDVWISLGLHGVLILVLGVWVVVTVQATPVLSVVAATVESNEVLMETPMESISELESTSMETSEITTPETSQLEIKVDTDAISVQQVDLGIDSLVEASSITQQMSKAGAPGNKLAEGAEFFGSKATGNRFVYIVDASPSMRRDRAFDAAKEEILRSLRSMQPKQRFAVLFFGGQVETLEIVPGQRIDQPVSATQENIEKAVQWLRKVTVQPDGKPPIDAMKSALELQPDGIFLLFDGDTKLDNWTQVIRKLNTSEGLLSDGEAKVPIHVIHFFRDEFQRSMQRLAQENGGSYRFVPRPDRPVFP